MEHKQMDVKVDTEPCHSQLWSALEQLDDSLVTMRQLYNRLAGTSEPDSDACEKEQPPPFARVLSEASTRVQKAREALDNLQTDFEKLCLHGASH